MKPARWSIAAFALLAAIWLSLSILEGGESGLLRIFALVGAPLGAVFACVVTRLRLPPASAPPWSALAASALAAAFAGAAAGLDSPGAEVAGRSAMAISHTLFAVALAWIIHQRDRGRVLEIVLDALLIIAAVTVVLMRWAPGPRTLFETPGWNPSTETFGLVAGPAAALCAVAFALVLLLSQRKSAGAESAAALAGSTGLLALSITPVAMGNPGGAGIPLPYDVAAVAGWGFLAFSSLRIAASGSGNFAGPFADPASARLRQSVAPIVALVMAAAVLDGSFRPPIRESTAIALGVLGVVLALRVSHLLEATKNRSAERRQLAQSRALIEVSQALAGTTELDETLEMVTRWACRLLNAKAAGIELLSDDGDTLEFRAGVGFPSEFIGLRFPVNDSFTGRVVLEGRTRVEADSQAVEDMSMAARMHLARSPIASAPLRYRERILGVLSCVGTDLFDEGDLELLGAMADQAAIAIENARLFQQVHSLSKLDPLTGLSNRRQFEHDLDREFAAARRGRRLIAVMFDLNEFKEYNDRFGHLAGDDVLRAFGDVLRTETRSMNHAARYGGDEFIVLLTEADRAGARIFTERVRRRFQRASARLGRAALNVAAGFAEYAPDMATPDDLIAAADRAMYQVKASRSRAV